MKKVRVLVSVLLAFAMLFSAAALADYSVDTLEVKIWDNNQLAGLQEIADLWTEQSGVKVNIQVVNWDNYWTLLEAGATGGDMPDVFWMHSNNAEMYMSAQKLLDLTDYIANSDVVKLENYYQGITDLYSKDGKYYAVAKDHDTIVLGRGQTIRFGLKGKTLCAYYPLDPKKVAQKYKVEEAKGKKFEEVPCLYRIKNERRCQYAKDLFDRMMKKRKIQKGKELNDEYRIPFEETEFLIAKGLIKEVKKRR